MQKDKDILRDIGLDCGLEQWPKEGSDYLGELIYSK